MCLSVFVVQLLTITDIELPEPDGQYAWSFGDYGSISSWALNAVNTLFHYSIINDRQQFLPC